VAAFETLADMVEDDQGGNSIRVPAAAPDLLTAKRLAIDSYHVAVAR